MNHMKHLEGFHFGGYGTRQALFSYEPKEMGLIFASTEIAKGEVASICPVICKVIFGHEYIICTKPICILQRVVSRINGMHLEKFPSVFGEPFVSLKIPPTATACDLCMFNFMRRLSPDFFNWNCTSKVSHPCYEI